jgi:hypothetical protein
MALLCSTLAAPPAPAQKPETLPLQEIKPGMKGIAKTIFEGDTIEDMELEVVGVMANFVGPKQDIILVRLKGAKPEFTGVVSGMSGSPVYINGKLAGALSYRLGIFAKEPLAGVTPIENIWESEPPATRADAGTGWPPATSPSPGPVPLPAELASRVGAGAGAFLAPIETPLAFSGFRADVLSRFQEHFTALGMIATPGGTAPARPDDAAIKPGDMVSMGLVQGDLSIAASCTVTAIVGDRVFICGHPVLAQGHVEMPMNRARVVTTASSALASTKLTNNGGLIGAIRQDRLTAVMGRLGDKARLIPVELTLVTPGAEKKVQFEVIENTKLTPVLVSLVTFNGIVANTAYSEGMSFQLSGGVQLRGYPAVNLENMFAPTDLGIPDGFFVSMAVQNTFTRIYTNPYERPQIERVTLRVEAVPERRVAAIESAWSDKSQVSPGDTVNVKVLVRSYRGTPVMQEVPITIPPQVPRGPLRILVSDSESLNRVSRFFSFSPQSRLSGLGQLITLLNRERRNNRLYVTLLQPSPTLLLDDKELPNAPLSQINVLDQRRTGSAASLLLRESIAGEWSTGLNQVITGQQSITITVR